ncbi:DNA-binding GntR family transcriptional regulator [Ancylobacter sp. 3268]|uniref:GntR family transcriptional regulator n=1 Tax=Ancylobacter sp. 3268 TaxID=2817752 RepID=UPI0028561E34|nr:GntR family transcriptional regulator [Ancylobacter sp. 3268]MDR6953322.1 DNA-binding GntR family transcriptional regulator [Ancylobacter sp. 3268]
MRDPDAGKAAHTLSGQIADALRQRLLMGELLPGAKVSLRSLAASFGTSMQPARDAVSSLVAEEALEITPTRVIQVPELSRQNCDDIFRMRVLIEGDAAALFVRRASEQEFAKLQALSEAVRPERLGMAFTDHMRAHIQGFNDWSFFVGDRCGSPLMRALIHRLRVRMAPVVALALCRDADEDYSFLEFSTHIMMEMAWVARSRDGERMRDLRRSDILTYQRYLYRRLGWTLDGRSS